MKTVLVLAALVAVALGGAVPTHHELETKPVDQEFVVRQKKIYGLLKHVTETLYDEEYYKIGLDYDIEANVEHYTNKKAVEEFLRFYRHGMLPKNWVFSVYYEQMREEAVALYHLFYYAKDFETFYKTASWARVHLNEGLFTYAYSIAVLHRPDTHGFALPSPYEVYPYFFVNADVIAKMWRVKMQEGVIDTEFAAKYGIVVEENNFVFHANYSGWSTFDNEEQRLSYFTEDIGLNTYYYYFHAAFPFWMNGEEFGFLKERRGELFFHFHKQLLARYYLERLTNGLGEIPVFSWRFPFKTGYTPNMVYHNLYPFVHRNNDYKLQTPANQWELEYLESYEQQFNEFLDQGYFKKYNWEVDFRNSKAVNFVGNYWQSNADLYEKFGSRNYEQYYEIIARVLLGAGPEPKDKYMVAPAVLEHFQTALRDPAFFQLYKRILYYFIEYKQYLEPYTKKNLFFEGVKIEDVQVGELVTYFDFFDFFANNAIFQGKTEKTQNKYLVRQPRINHKPFDIKIDIESTVATDAIVKIFLAPKYDSNGFPIRLEDNWMNFFEWDSFFYKLSAGKNNIVRKSNEFTLYKEDDVPAFDFLKTLESGKVYTHMAEEYFLQPHRLLLPKGTKAGFPFQFFVMVYPYVERSEASSMPSVWFKDEKPFGYPFDRPVEEIYFNQPNMYFKDINVYHQGEDFAYYYNVPGFKSHENTVPKH